MKDHIAGAIELAKGQLPTSRKKAVQIATDELIESICAQTKNVIRINFAHVRANTKENMDGEKYRWWCQQLGKWEMLWNNLLEITQNFTNFSDLRRLEALVESAFEQYEDMHRETMGMKISVPLIVIKDEAKKWRNIAVYISMIHKHMMLGELRNIQSE